MLRELIAEYGLPLVFANVLLESLGLPLPALPTLILTGAITFAAGPVSAPDGWLPQLPLLAIVAIAMIAALLGDMLWFWLGKRYGNRVLRFLCTLSPDHYVHNFDEVAALFAAGTPDPKAVGAVMARYATEVVDLG